MATATTISWLGFTELLRGYHCRYVDDLNELDEVIGAELGFDIPIIDPDTGEVSPHFSLRGRVDAVVRL